MRQIDTNDTRTTNTKPAPPAAGTPRWFQDGGAGSGTVVPAWFLNSTQDEIVNTIAAAGLTPDKTDDTQLSQAIPIIAAAAYTGLLAVNGYQIFPNGLILQWGEESVSTDGTKTVTWPLAFPTAILQAIASQGGTFSVTSDAGAGISNLTNTTGILRNGSNSNMTLRWFAIGH